MASRNRAGRIRQTISDYLSFNRTEQRGLLVMSAILLCLIMANALLPSGTLSPAPRPGSFAREIEAFEKEWRRAADSDSMARLTRYGHTASAATAGHFSKEIRLPGVEMVMLDLNKADTLDLQQLKGIGPGFARRICTYRDRLGGYFDRRQVLEVYGMDSARYRMIEKHLFVTTDSLRKIDLNRVTLKELLRHPYFPYGVARNLILSRQQNKGFRSMEEVRHVAGITDSLWRRMVVYLRIVP